MRLLSQRLRYFSSNHSKICIIGGGTAGLSVSASLLKNNVEASDVRIFQAADYHYYQPGWTMVGAGLTSLEATRRPIREVIPQGIKINKQNVAKVNPLANSLETVEGETFSYDHLVIASGFKHRYDKIKGSKELLEDRNSNVGSIYWGNYAQKVARLKQSFKGGRAIFTEPPLPIKCAGAPQKILYLLTSEWQDKKLPLEVEFYKSAAVMFGVPKYSKSLEQTAASYGIKTHFKHNLVEVTPSTAIFENLDTKERVEKPFEFLHLVPPMSPHAYIAESGLADANGFVDVDKFTMQHKQFPNVWSLGDCSNLPNSKTAAAIFSQNEMLQKNLLTVLANPSANLPGRYEGYASCPLFTGKGKLMLAEFKYDAVVDQTFFSDQEKPRRSFYYLKRYIFPFVYWNLVPRGLWVGRKGIKLF